MPTEASIIYRANKEDSSESVFYHELMNTLATVNQVRRASGEADVTYREAVTQGLMLPDSFTGKIKNGKYVPTREKLENCAAYLGIRPEVWDTYVRRYANDRLNDALVIDLFRMLASLPEPADSIVLKGAVSSARKWIEEAAIQKPVAA